MKWMIFCGWVLSAFLGSARADNAGRRCAIHRSNIDSLSPENSLSGLRRLIRLSDAYPQQLGAEFDVRHTRDGVALISHDSTLKRTARSKHSDTECPLSTSISDLRWETIQNLCVLSSGESVPTFEEYLKELESSDLEIFAEMKDPPTLETIDILRRVDRQRLWIMGGSRALMKEIRALGFQTMYWSLASWDLFPIPYLLEAPPKGVDAVGVSYISGGRVESLKRRGYRLGVGTKNSSSEIEGYFSAGVDFVFTDQPTECLKVININR